MIWPRRVNNPLLASTRQLKLPAQGQRAMYKAENTDLREALEFETFAQNLAQGTEDAKEGIRAFVEKREPEFNGR